MLSAASHLNPHHPKDEGAAPEGRWSEQRERTECVLADDAGERAAGGGVEAFGHAACEIGFAAGANGFAH